MLNGRVMMIGLIVGLIKRTLYKMIQYFSKPCNRFGRNVKVELDLSNYETKADLKGANGVDMSKLEVKSNLANLKAETDKIDVEKLKTIPVNLSKPSNVVNNEILKKTVYEKLDAKISAIETSKFCLKTKYDKYLIAVDLLKKTYCNAKIAQIEGKILRISGLATTAALTTVESKILDVSNLVRKTDYDSKISDIESKCFTAADAKLDSKRKKKGLVSKYDIFGFINNPDLDKDIATLATKA